MQERLLDKIAEPFNIKLPEQSTMDKTIDGILPAIITSSNAITEEEYYLNRQWVEMHDDLGHSAVELYIFQEGGRLFISNNGKIENASWDILEGTQKFIISSGARGGELYTLAFLDADFFIIKHHGDPRAHKKRYRMFVNERVAGRLEWNEALEMLYAKYRNTNTSFLAVTAVVLIVILIFIILSYGGRIGE
ncbi:MAG: hypothetical protein AAF828_11215 [Bacteroidota bacterium]